MNKKEIANKKRRKWNILNNWIPPVNSGKNHYRWKGGRKILKGGYIGIYISNKQSYVPEHRLVMEKHIGRKLKRKEIVHHINHNKQDNRIENLKLYESSGKHISENHINQNRFGRFQRRGSKVEDVRKGQWAICICKKKFYVIPSRSTKYCSQKCMGNFYSIKRKGVPRPPHSEKTKQKMRDKALMRKRNNLGIFI